MSVYALGLRSGCQDVPCAGLAARVRAARRQPLGGAMRDQAGDGGAAGLVGVEHLAEEDPEGHERVEDAVLPGAVDFCQSLGEAPGREDVGEGEFALPEELPAEGVDLLAEASVRG